MTGLEVNLEMSKQLEGMKSWLFQDTRLVPSTHMECYNSSSRGANTLFWL